VQRQTVAEYRDAVQELRRNPASGFEKLERIGAIREVAWADRAQAVAQAYGESQCKGQRALVVCSTHDEIDHVTEAIRANRIHTGDLGAGVQVARDVSLNWTTAQKRDMRNFRAGHRLGFHRSVKGIQKNETLEVVRVDAKGIVTRNHRGGERTLTVKQARSFDVYERRAVEVAAGDKLLLTANRRESGFRATNGEIVTVSRVDESGRIQLEDGRELPSTFRQFAHGYAVTAHRSQGKSVDSVIISADGMRKELFYVAATRGRQSVQVITSDKELLRESVARSGARQSASELARKARPGLHQGSYRGLAAARELAAHMARHELPPSKQQERQRGLIREVRRERTRERGIGR
jgi:hypothetical protein